MRVAINLEQLLYRIPGGIGRYTAELARLLPATYPSDDYAGFVARHSRSEIDQTLRKYDVSQVGVTSLPLPRPVLYDLWHTLNAPSLTTLASTFKRSELVHTPCVGVPAVARRQKLVTTVHDVAPLIYPEAFTPRGRWFHHVGLRSVERHADLVITVSRSARDEICERTALDPDRIRVVYNGVKAADVPDAIVDRVRRRNGLGDRPYILWVGTIEPRKNVLMLLQAFANLRATTDLPHRLALVGPTGWAYDEAAYTSAASTLGDSLKIVGQVDDVTLHALYRGADAFVFPSLHEGFGLPVLEAMVQGTPVVSSNVGSLAEISGDAAVLVDPTDVEAWTASIEQILTDDGLRGYCAEQGTKRAAEFTWERTVHETHAVYEEALS